MKVAHLSGRFVRALWPGPPRAPTTRLGRVGAHARRVRAVRAGSPNHDRRHAIGVARRRARPASPAPRTPATPVARRRAPPRHRQARRRPRRVRAGRGDGRRARSPAAEHAEAVVGRRPGSPAGSASTCATPSSAPTGSASPASRRRPRTGRPCHHDPARWDDAGDPCAGHRRARRRRQRLTSRKRCAELRRNESGGAREQQGEHHAASEGEEEDGGGGEHGDLPPLVECEPEGDGNTDDRSDGGGSGSVEERARCSRCVGASRSAGRPRARRGTRARTRSGAAKSPPATPAAA